MSYAVNHRVKMDSKHFDKGSTEPILVINETSEGTTDGSSRSLRVEKNKNGTKENETIRTGGVEYIRTGGQKWAKRGKDSNPNRFSVWGDPSGRKEEKFDFAYLGKVQLFGLEVDMYESRKFRSYQLRPDWVHAYTIVNRLWIGADGKFIKQQSQTIEGDGHMSIDIVWTYEYPAKLKIEAPIK